MKGLGRLELGLFSFYMREKSQGNPLLRYWLQGYLDISIAALLQTGWPSFHSFSEAFNTSLGLLIVCVAVVTPVVAVYVSLTQSWASSPYCTVLFEEFRGGSVRSRLFYFVFLFRRLFYALMLIFASPWPKFQAISFAAASLTVLFTQNFAYLLLYQPYKDRLHTWAALSSEACGTLICFALISYTFSTAVSSVFATFCQINLFLSLILGNLLACAASIRTFIDVLRRYKAIRSSQQVTRSNVKPNWGFAT